MNRNMPVLLLALLALLACAPLLAGCVDDSDASDSRAQARNVILMIPDGMGLSNVTAARTYKFGPGGGRLSFETLPYIGFQSTHSRNSFVTDSAAAASAWANGEKFNNDEISCHDNDDDGACDDPATMRKTILEIARDSGKAAGLVATSDITQATPAAFGAHVHSRLCESEIFEQLYTSGIEVLLGGGVSTNRGSCVFEDTIQAYNAALAADALESHGYAWAGTEDELETVDPATTGKLLGLFRTSGGLTPEYRRGAANTEPTLAEMTSKALAILERDPEGFFLMVEGSQVDWANHARNLPYMLGEVLAFSDAVQVVRDWIAADPSREANTLLIVVADHETGGVSLVGPLGSQASAGDSETQAAHNTGYFTEGGIVAGDPMVDGDGAPVLLPNFQAAYGSKYENYASQAEHTAEDTIIWSNNKALARALDNTELYGIMKDFLTGAI